MHPNEIREMLLVALQTAIIYAFLVLAIRLVGRRPLGQLSSLDLLILILLGSAVETSMVRASTLLRMGFVSATVLFALNRLLALGMLRSKRFRHLVGAGPVLVVHNGELIDSHCKRIGLTRADVLEALREREIGSLDEVQSAVMEPDGAINVIRTNSAVS